MTGKPVHSSIFGLLLALTLAGAGCEIHRFEVRQAPQALPPPPAPPALAQEPSTADVVAAALPAVVLLIQEHPAKPGVAASTSFGAGFLTRDGLVVTSLHVIDGEGKLSAMLYKPGRQSYTPMDGGLMRLLFENQADLVPIERVSADAVTDLAVLRVSADTSHLPKLVWSSEDVRPGDRVLALGHPQETVWSFSEGVVGALQYGILQHTAIVGPGSSGGPLLNARGEVVGVNIAKVMNQPTGLSFARPIALVASTFSSEKVTSPLDLSSPASAALSCWRAQELALSETAECFDWDREWESFRGFAVEAQKLATDSQVKDKIGSCHLGPQAKTGWITSARESAIHVFDPTRQESKGAGDSAVKKIPDKLSPTSAEVCVMPETPADAAFAADYKNPKRLADRLRNGLRVEKTEPVSASLAWVLLASRAADGTVAQFTELYVKIDGKWVQRMAPSPDEIAGLPKGWPVPIITIASKKPLYIAAILKEAATMDHCPFGAASSDAASGGGSRAVFRPGFVLQGSQ